VWQEACVASARPADAKRPPRRTGNLGDHPRNIATPIAAGADTRSGPQTRGNPSGGRVGRTWRAMPDRLTVMVAPPYFGIETGEQFHLGEPPRRGPEGSRRCPPLPGTSPLPRLLGTVQHRC
jgi:hypothetical protein